MTKKAIQYICDILSDKLSVDIQLLAGTVYSAEYASDRGLEYAVRYTHSENTLSHRILEAYI